MKVVDFFLSEGWRVTSGFGNRIDPATKVTKHHPGIDFGGRPRGSGVKTPYGGVVRATGTYGNRGVVVSIDLGDGVLQITQHHQSAVVKKGDVVKAGDVIAKNGDTGYTTGPHVHYELRVDTKTDLGSRVWGNPENYINKPAYQPTPPSNIKPTSYTVKPGDNLMRIANIARGYGYNCDWKDLAKFNHIATPHLILPGDVIHFTQQDAYVVKPRDTLWGIAQAYGYTVKQLADFNKISNPNLIHPGDLIKFPPKR
jgi:murein DD-endopeptidase MepM/ murein hydrolase activator NlpD